ncbi:MAG: YbbR-like domain-containing protein [Bacteroidetes bacterium]|nr:MAG: YbbR-like domain-containing protein [Bacteroidota bacterium]
MADEKNVLIAPRPAKRLRLDRRLTIVLVCFFISTIFWLLIALTHEYNSQISFPVVYKNLPGKKVIINELPDSMTLQIRTNGFRLLSYEFSSRRKSIEVDVASRMAGTLGANNEVLALPSKTFTADFSRQFGPEVSITGFFPDSIVFYFSEKISKRLPVKVNLKLEMDKQHSATGRTQVIPDTVEVSGPPSVIQKLKYVETDQVNLENVRASVELSMPLAKNRLLTYNTGQVQVKVPIEKFTESSIEARVRAVNVPAGYTMKTFPDKVTIRYQVALSKFNDIKDYNFDVIVNAESITKLNPSKVKAELVVFPEMVKITGIEPDMLDYILRKQ